MSEGLHVAVVSSLHKVTFSEEFSYVLQPNLPWVHEDKQNAWKSQNLKVLQTFYLK